MVKVFAFDLDGTLTQHKTPLDDQNRAILEKLAKQYTLIMVGAGSCMRIHHQLGGFPMDVIGNYGMQHERKRYWATAAYNMEMPVPCGVCAQVQTVSNIWRDKERYRADFAKTM